MLKAKQSVSLLYLFFTKEANVSQNHLKCKCAMSPLVETSICMCFGLDYSSFTQWFSPKIARCKKNVNISYEFNIFDVYESITALDH